MSIFKIEKDAERYIETREVKEIPNISDIDQPHWLCDLRGADVSKFDLSDKYETLKHADFDDGTLFPTEDKMPLNFNPRKKYSKAYRWIHLFHLSNDLFLLSYLLNYVLFLSYKCTKFFFYLIVVSMVAQHP